MVKRIAELFVNGAIVACTLYFCTNDLKLCKSNSITPEIFAREIMKYRLSALDMRTDPCPPGAKATYTSMKNLLDNLDRGGPRFM
jgi:hypothetical protein